MHVCVAQLSNLKIQKSSPQVRTKKREIASFIRAHQPLEEVASDERMLGYRELYERVGAAADKLEPSCQTLIGMIHKSGAIPTINTLVDLYNAVSASRLVTIGAHDASHILGRIRIGITTGTERFIPLFSTKQEKIRPGEYAYMDDSDILCRLDIRQCHKTRITLDTKEAVFFANSNPRMEKEILIAAVQEVCELARNLLGADAKIVKIF